MLQKGTTLLPPITPDTLPKTVEQQTLAAVLRIEQLLINLLYTEDTKAGKTKGKR